MRSSHSATDEAPWLGQKRVSQADYRTKCVNPVVPGSNPGLVLRVSKGHLGVKIPLFRTGLGVSPLAVSAMDHRPGTTTSQNNPKRAVLYQNDSRNVTEDY